MANVVLDTGWPDSLEAVRLGEFLEDEDAWRFAVRLWSWGIDTGREDGRVALPVTNTGTVSAHSLAMVCRYRGDGNRLLAALTHPEVRVLIEESPGRYYMRGWSRNEKYFKERTRLREKQRRYRERKAAQKEAEKKTTGPKPAQATVAETTIALPVTLPCIPSPSPSPSPSTSNKTDLSEALPVTLPATNTATSTDTMTVSQVVHELQQPPHCWRPPRHLDEKRIADSCPVTRAVFESAVRATRERAAKPGFAYFASVLETESRDRSPTGRGRAPPERLNTKDQGIAAALAAVEAFNATR